jgi:hypothetical protein
MIIDIILLLVFGLVTWSVAGEGAWGAGLVCLSVIFAGLLAMNFFEPVALLLERYVTAMPPWSQRFDIIALIGIFAGTILLLREATDRLLPTYVAMHGYVFEAARWGAAALTGYVTIAFLLTALHTARLPREFIGFKPERKNLFGMLAPDMQWLGFTQYVSERVFVKNYYVQDPQGGRTLHKRMFDGPYALSGLSLPPETDGAAEQIWPTFPIRYATRRDTLSSTHSTVTAGAPGEGIRRRSSGSSKSKSKGAPKF